MCISRDAKLHCCHRTPDVPHSSFDLDTKSKGALRSLNVAQLNLGHQAFYCLLCSRLRRPLCISGANHVSRYGFHVNLIYAVFLFIWPLFSRWLC